MKSFTTYLNEVRKSDLESHALQDKIKAGNEGDFSQYPFNDIFGNKLRIVIPFHGKSIPLTETQVVQALGNEGFSAYFDRGIAVNKKTNQTIKLGKLFRKLSKKDDYWEQVLHWWEMKQDPTKKMEDPTGVSIVISRSPIDIIRMSDHSEWESCHAPPGKPGHIDKYWPCAAQEARTGGAIAYVVKNKDLQNVINLQAPDIFKDKDRKIEGVEPLERVRLRRFSFNEQDILVPVLKTYGIRHVDFLKSVIEWAKKAQEKYIDFKNPPDWEDVKFHGGTYEDNQSHNHEIWNAFFGTNVWGRKSSEDREQEEEYSDASTTPEDKADDIYDRAQRQIEAKSFEHIHVSAEVEEYEAERFYISSDAWINFPIPKELFIKMPEENFGQWKYPYEKELKNALDFRFESVYAHIGPHEIDFSVDIQDEDDGGHYDNANDAFESFLDQLENIDRDYDEHYQKFKIFLRQYGYISPINPSNFAHFHLDESEDEDEDADADIGL